MHDERFAFERCVIRRSRDHRSGEGFSAERFQSFPEDTVGRFGLRLNSHCRKHHETNQRQLFCHYNQTFIRYVYYFGGVKGKSVTLNQSPRPSFVRSIRIISSNVNGRAPRRPNTET